ncbi:MAG: glutathione S-transferase family protein [Polyangiaceae bacterium]|nr:glutathione S-transferase family protein [Polyangiaceae bacterium]
MKLHYHPISSYSQKTLMAFHEKGVAFTPEIVDLFSPEGRAEYKKFYPLAKIPVLVLDNGWPIPESSIIIEYIDTHFDSGTQLIPADKDLARRARMFDRWFDQYVNEPFQKIFFDGRRPEDKRDPLGVTQARATLTTMYGMLDNHLAKNTWSVGDTFTMAECAAAPALAYARMIEPFDKHTHLTAYFGRLAERPSFLKVMEEAKPYLAKLMG